MYPGPASATGLLRHRRGAQGGRRVQPVAGPPAPSICRRPGPYRFLRLAPGCHSGASPSRRRRDLGSAVPADRSGRHRPRLRSGDPGQQPVRQGAASPSCSNREYGISLPRRMQIEFSQVVQGETDRLGLEMTAQQIYSLLENGIPQGDLALRPRQPSPAGRERHQRRRPGSLLRRREAALARDRQGPLEALVAALPVKAEIMDYHEHAIGAGANARRGLYRDPPGGPAPAAASASTRTSPPPASAPCSAR